MKETKRQKVNKLPIYNNSCNFEGYDSQKLMFQTTKLRNLITKRGTFEMLIPLCCTTTPLRYMKFRELMKGISSKTLARRLKELERDGILERHAYNEIPPKVEYKLTKKGQN
jgi:DNA-binding HxlR family transcriptional regulator